MAAKVSSLIFHGNRGLPPSTVAVPYLTPSLSQGLLAIYMQKECITKEIGWFTFFRTVHLGFPDLSLLYMPRVLLLTRLCWLKCWQVQGGDQGLGECIASDQQPKPRTWSQTSLLKDAICLIFPISLAIILNYYFSTNHTLYSTMFYNLFSPTRPKKFMFSQLINYRGFSL